MSSWQDLLVSRIIRTGDLATVINWGIGPEDFTHGHPKALFEMLLGYHRQAETAGSVWGPAALQQMFPTVQLLDDPSMTTDALCHEVRKARIGAQLQKTVLAIEPLLQKDPIKAVEWLQDETSRLRNECTSKKVDVHISDSMQRVWNSYQATERGDNTCVYEWPWDPIQKLTKGVRPSDYIILYGRPKSMKSWILCYLVAFIISKDLNSNANKWHKILIYSKEMDADEIFERIGCLLANVSYANFTGGTMNPEERYRFEYAVYVLAQLRAHLGIVCLSAQDVEYGRDTVTWLESKIDKYQPDAVFIDGLYLMSDGSGAKKQHERVANISREIRQLILRKRVPVVATVQANREAAKNEEANTEEVAFSDSLGQDATMLIRVVNEWKKKSDTLALVMGGSTRRFKLSGFRIFGIPATNFSYFGELNEGEAEGALKEDTAGKQAKGAKRQKKESTESAATGFQNELAGV